MEKQEIHLEELIVLLLVVTIVFTGYWYTNELIKSKQLAQKEISQFEKNCATLLGQKSSCALTERSYELGSEILCSDNLLKEQQLLLSRIGKSYNLFEVKELMRLSPLNEFEALSKTVTIGEIGAGNDFYGKVSGLKLQVLNNIGAIEECGLKSGSMKSYAYCDLQYAKSFLKKNQKPLSGEYFKKAEEGYNSGDYFAAIHYTTAAIAYQDKAARAGYGDLIEAADNGLAC